MSNQIFSETPDGDVGREKDLTEIMDNLIQSDRVLDVIKNPNAGSTTFICFTEESGMTKKALFDLLKGREVSTDPAHWKWDMNAQQGYLIVGDQQIGIEIIHLENSITDLIL